MKSTPPPSNPIPESPAIHKEQANVTDGKADFEMPPPSGEGEVIKLNVILFTVLLLNFLITCHQHTRVYYSTINTDEHLAYKLSCFS